MTLCFGRFRRIFGGNAGPLFGRNLCRSQTDDGKENPRDRSQRRRRGNERHEGYQQTGARGQIQAFDIQGRLWMGHCSFLLLPKGPVMEEPKPNNPGGQQCPENLSEASLGLTARCRSSGLMGLRWGRRSLGRRWSGNGRLLDDRFWERGLLRHGGHGGHGGRGLRRRQRRSTRGGRWLETPPIQHPQNLVSSLNHSFTQNGLCPAGVRRHQDSVFAHPRFLGRFQLFAVSGTQYRNRLLKESAKG